MQETENFHRTIAQIGNEVKSLEVTDDLFVPKAFVAIYEAPQKHLTSAIELMGRWDVSSHQKAIIGYAMQRLPVDQFVAFVSASLDSVEQHTTDIGVLESAAFAPLNWGTQSLIMHYQNPKVRAILQRLMGEKELPPSRKAYIRNEILTGKAKRDYLDYMEMLGRAVKPEEMR